jgi:hypothetical protein
MKSVDPHPVPDDLKCFVAGRLKKAEADAVIVHLSECESCLAITDGFWHQRFNGEIPDLDRDVAGRMEGGLRRRIHRSELGKQAVRLSTQGLLLAWLALLRPLFGRRFTLRSKR